MSNLKVFIVEAFPGADFEYRNMWSMKGFIPVENIDDCDIIQYTGGEDVSPKLYGHSHHRTTSSNPKRDLREKMIFSLGLKGGKYQVGICRGAQFLNVMCGGRLFQDVDNHACRNGHKMYDFLDDKWKWVSSTHHQMMQPSSEANIMGASNESTVVENCLSPGRETSYYRDPEKDMKLDIEILHYPKDKVLCFQPHPEYNGFPDCTKSFFSHVNHLLENC